jgi:alpha-L-rhamnosidase
MAGIRPAALRCEYLVNPSGIQTSAPRFSWTLEHSRPTERSQQQTACQILAAESPQILAENRGDLWDTGKTASDETAHIVYRGRPLRSRMQVWWKVRVWDRDGQPSPWSRPAHFSIGLLRPEDWTAQWIADAQPAQPPKPAHNGYHSQIVPSPDAVKWVTLDLGRSQTFEAVRLFPARPYDWQPDTPGFLFPLRFKVEAADTPDFAGARLLADQTEQDTPDPGTEVPIYRFAPVTARYVRLTVTRLRARDGNNHAFALAELQVLSGTRNLALKAPVSALDSIETSAWAAVNLTDGDTESHPSTGFDPLPAPMFRKSFSVQSSVVRATVYVTALGLYELRLNGQRIGDRLLAPEWTDYHTRVQYQTYDVTKQVRSGENVIGALVGDGWYAGRIGMSDALFGRLRAVYGRKPQLLAQLEIEHADGQTQVIGTDGTWASTLEGPIRSADILDGEVYDARREMPGWDAPGFEATDWKPVETQPVPSIALVAQPNEPMRVIQTLKPVALTEPKPGVYIYDLGQNMVGWCRLKMRGPAGTVVTLRHAEMLNDDGTLYTANLRGAAQVDRYIMRGEGEEVFEPRFTYHGFRYVEVTGLPKRPAKSALTGIVFNSSSPEVGTFECSSPMLNRLWQNILWTQRANLMSAPTDCPQRDERLGWMGDIQAFAQTAIFQMDMAGFFTKWLQDVRDAQSDEGSFPDFAPHPYGRNRHFTGAPAWGDAGTVVPWRAYVNYGDRRILTAHFDAACRWIESIRRRNPDLLWREGRGNDYGDWLNGDTLIQEGWPRRGGEVPKEVLATAFFAHSTELVAKMAEALGREPEAKTYRQLFEEIKAAFQRAYVSPDGRVLGDTQAGYALALHFHLLPDSLRPEAVKHLLAGIESYQGHISTGIQTTHRMMLELTASGHTDIAYRLLNNRTFPSWGYSIDNGATTIWERWDGYVKGRGFQDPGMNSFNHWALGAVGEWMARVIGGIHPEEESPGYKRFTLKPQPGGGLTHARLEYGSIRGRIACAWKQEGDTRTLSVTIPPGTMATVYVPTENPASVTESGKPILEAAGVKVLRSEKGAVVLEVGSGSYRFASKR